MAKHKKKRNKTYQGWDAASPAPTVHRIKAVERSRIGQWRHENRRAIKVWLVILAIVALLTLIVSGLISLLS